MLGVMLALRSALVRRDAGMVARWLIALAIYPTLVLLLGGFLSFGTTAVIIVLSGIVVTAKSNLRVAIGTTAATLLGISIFLGYFEHRQKIRDAVWGRADSEARIQATLEAARDVSLFDPTNPEHLKGLDARLNQNFFVGVAASRIASGQGSLLLGRSLWEGALALVPRALWPEKPVFSGSGTIVIEMTGLRLNQNTAWGVGNVMEFQINFGVAGVILGFIALGFVIGKLDRLAAIADTTGRLDDVFLYFLPGVAMIQPNGSIVDIIGGAAAALAAGFMWKWAWTRWPKPLPASTLRAQRTVVVEHA
jgi:hypothetical protein